ncbi:MAG TPA: hypothetical protein VMS16_16175, partial [Mycobacterium sp.]|nr:hypothetical protein [Mycobacterium sp.]
MLEEVDEPVDRGHGREPASRLPAATAAHHTDRLQTIEYGHRPFVVIPELGPRPACLDRDLADRPGDDLDILAHTA